MQAQVFSRKSMEKIPAGWYNHGTEESDVRVYEVRVQEQRGSGKEEERWEWSLRESTKTSESRSRFSPRRR